MKATPKPSPTLLVDCVSANCAEIAASAERITARIPQPAMMNFLRPGRVLDRTHGVQIRLYIPTWSTSSPLVRLPGTVTKLKHPTNSKGNLPVIPNPL